MFISAFVSFFAVWLLLQHLSLRKRIWMCSHMGWVDLVVHGTILWLFLGTSTHGLLQAEAAGIMFSLYLRAYRWYLRGQGLMAQERRTHIVAR